MATTTKRQGYTGYTAALYNFGKACGNLDSLTDGTADKANEAHHAAFCAMQDAMVEKFGWEMTKQIQALIDAPLVQLAAVRAMPEVIVSKDLGFGDIDVDFKEAIIAALETGDKTAEVETTHGMAELDVEEWLEGMSL